MLDLDRGKFSRSDISHHLVPVNTIHICNAKKGLYIAHGASFEPAAILKWGEKVGGCAVRRPDAYLKEADDIYVTDAYHSLSIEGYKVSRELIERVRGGGWNPDEDKDDREHWNALATRGYWQAYQAVRESVRKVLIGENPGTVCENDHRDWYREMFGPGVTAGFLRAASLAGYRNDQVFIRGSMHVPPRREAVRDCMPAFFDLLREEPEPSVRVALGHFMFVYIDPYMDGNGRIGRFLMNVMLAAGGYPWTVIPVEKRNTYMDSLESASVKQDIAPFAAFLGSLVSKGLKK